MDSTIREVFAGHFERFRRTHKLPLRALKAGQGIARCRTAALGGHIKRCPAGHLERVWYNSCRHRCCPLCSFLAVQRWVLMQSARLPACDYFHVVFTLPDGLNPLWAYNRKAFTNLLFATAWACLKEMLANPKHLGALPGALAGFHSWGQTLWIHPHLHMLVTAGGVDGEGQWRPCPYSGLLPVRALSVKFRGKLCARLRLAIQKQKLIPAPPHSRQQWLNLLNKLGRKKWNVRIQPRYRHGRGVVRYLGRYLKGGPVSDRRLSRPEADTVRLRYKDNFCNPPKRRAMDFTRDEFMSRYLAHVPEPGQHMVRAYGLFASSKRNELDRVRRQLGQLPLEEAEGLLRQTLALEQATFREERCPRCGRLLLRTPLPRSRAPPPQPRS